MYSIVSLILFLCLLADVFFMFWRKHRQYIKAYKEHYTPIYEGPEGSFNNEEDSNVLLTQSISSSKQIFQDMIEFVEEYTGIEEQYLYTKKCYDNEYPDPYWIEIEMENRENIKYLSIRHSLLVKLNAAAGYHIHLILARSSCVVYTFIYICINLLLLIYLISFLIIK